MRNWIIIAEIFIYFIYYFTYTRGKTCEIRFREILLLRESFMVNRTRFCHGCYLKYYIMQIDKHFLCYRKSWSPGSSYSWWQGHLKWPGLLSKLFHSSGSLDKGWRWPQKSVNLLSHQGRLWVVFYNIVVVYSSIRIFCVDICLLSFKITKVFWKRLFPIPIQ